MRRKGVKQAEYHRIQPDRAKTSSSPIVKCVATGQSPRLPGRCALRALSQAPSCLDTRSAGAWRSKRLEPGRGPQQRARRHASKRSTACAHGGHTRPWWAGRWVKTRSTSIQQQVSHGGMRAAAPAHGWKRCAPSGLGSARGTAPTCSPAEAAPARQVGAGGAPRANALCAGQTAAWTHVLRTPS